jgi:hypothetical protein
VVWEGWHREVSPYPDQGTLSDFLTAPRASGRPVAMPQPDPLTSFVQRGMAAQKAVDDAIPKDTLEQLSALSLLMARAGEAPITFRKAKRYDYIIGMGRLGDREPNAPSMLASRRFSFNEICRYGALISGDDQHKAIAAYMHEHDFPIF